jgi:hypothetical protein
MPVPLILRETLVQIKGGGNDDGAPEWAGAWMDVLVDSLELEETASLSEVSPGQNWREWFRATKFGFTITLEMTITGGFFTSGNPGYVFENNRLIKIQWLVAGGSPGGYASAEFDCIIESQSIRVDNPHKYRVTLRPYGYWG